MKTIKHVAERAGVSVSTVSHALSGKRPVSDATRAKILRAIDELNYRPSLQAQSLVTGRTHHIGLLFPREISDGGDASLNPIQLEMIVEVNTVLQANGYGLQLYTQNIITDIASICRQCDGLLLASVQLQDSRIEYLIREKFPFVMLGRPTQADDVYWVDTDFETMVGTQIEHLYHLGHRHILFLDRPERLFKQQFGYSVRARQGYIDACSGWGLEPVIVACDLSIEEGHRVLRKVLRGNNRLTALVSFNEAAAVGAYYALPELGLSVPGEFSLITFTSPSFLRSTVPQMTAMNNTGAVVSRTAAQLLLSLLNEEPIDQMHILIQSEMLQGATTGPAPSS